MKRQFAPVLPSRHDAVFDKVKHPSEYEEDHLVQKEGAFSLFRVPGQHGNLVRRYCFMLDQDYNQNKVVVSAYTQGLQRFAQASR